MAAGAKAIRAGEAFLELTVKDTRFASGLQASLAKMRQAGKSFAVIGASITAGGGALTAPFVKAIKIFSDYGFQLGIMSQKTGVGVSTLSELGYVADQSGTDLEALDKRIGFMQKSLSGLQDTNKKTAKAFALLGVNLAEIRSLSPEDQLHKLLEQISRLPDAATRAGVAMAIFGRGGRDLIPLIENWQTLSAEAQHFNLTVSPAAVARATVLHRAFGLVGATFKALAFAVGDALSEPLTRGLHSIAEITANAITWARANKGIIITAAAIGVAVTAVGIAISGLGFFLIAASVAASALVAAIGLLVSPFGLLGIAVIAGAVALVKFTDVGQAMFVSLSRTFGALARIAVDAFTSIGNALAGGDIQTAAEVLWTGLKLSWAKGTEGLQETWINFKDLFLNVTTNLVFEAEKIWVKLTSAIKGFFIDLKIVALQTIAQILNQIAAISPSLGRLLNLPGISAALSAAAVVTGLEKGFLESGKKGALGGIQAAQDEANKTRTADTADKLKGLHNDVSKAQGEFDAAREKAFASRETQFVGPGQQALKPLLDGIAASADGIVRSTFSGRLAPQIFGAAAGSDSKKQVSLLGKIARNTEKALKVHSGHHGLRVGGH